MFIIYHVSVLGLSSKYLGLALMVCFIVLIYSKLYSLNNFMKAHHELALRYKKDPERVQE